MDVFQYLDPYLVLQKYYQDRKKYDVDFSYSVWSAELGLSSSSTLRMMVIGKKRLSAGVAERFAQRSLATDEEKNYFRMLVVYVHAATPSEKNAIWASMAKLLAGKIEQKEVSDYFTYVSDLWCPKIMTLLSFEDRQWTTALLVTALQADLSAIETCLLKLERAGLIFSNKTAEHVVWKANDKLVLVSNKLGDVALRAYHDACMDEAKLAQSLPVESRRYKSLLVPLSPDEFSEIEREVNAFTKQLIAKYQASHYEGRKLYKLNLNYFPVSSAVE